MLINKHICIEYYGSDGLVIVILTAKPDIVILISTQAKSLCVMNTIIRFMSGIICIYKYVGTFINSLTTTEQALPILESDDHVRCMYTHNDNMIVYIIFSNIKYTTLSGLKQDIACIIVTRQLI